MEPEIIVSTIATVIAIIGIIVGYVKNKKVKQIAGALTPYLEGAAAYETGFADKNLTDAELITVGKLASKHYAAMKEVFSE